MKIYTILLFVVCSGRVAALNSTDDWHTVDRTDLYLRLPMCAKPCVRNVNQHILMGNTYCQSYGCVCSESTEGPNFLSGLQNVTDCASNACSAAADVEHAKDAYQDLCLIYAASANRPNKTQSSNTNVTLIMSEGYSDLTPCAKFVLNGCLNENGTRNEPHCEPFYKSDQWEKYQGVAAQRQCETSECLCKPPGFNTSFGVAYQTGVQYCGMFMSTAALKNQEYEDMQNVFATYCASEGYPPKDWILRLVGLHPGNSTGTRDNGTHDEEGWTLDNKLQMGLGAGVGIPGLMLASLAVFFAWRDFRWMRRAPARL